MLPPADYRIQRIVDPGLLPYGGHKFAYACTVHASNNFAGIKAKVECYMAISPVVKLALLRLPKIGRNIY